MRRYRAVLLRAEGVPVAAVVRLTPDTRGKSRPAKRSAASASKQSVEAKVRAAWRDGITISQLEREAGVSRSSAHKWNRVILSEREAQTLPAQQTQ